MRYRFARFVRDFGKGWDWETIWAYIGWGFILGFLAFGGAGLLGSLILGNFTPLQALPFGIATWVLVSIGLPLLLGFKEWCVQYANSVDGGTR